MSNPQDSKIPSFKDFRATVPAKIDEAADAILPVLHDPDHPVDDDAHDDADGLPRLFATIHYKSDARPEGYSSKDIWNMNNAANAHLPHLQQPWPHGDAEEPPVEDEDAPQK